MKFRNFRLVLGFYRSEEHAEEALHEARKNGFRRSAVAIARRRRFKVFTRRAWTSRPGCIRSRHGTDLRSAGRDRSTGFGGLVLAGLCGFLITWFGTLWLGFGIRKRVLAHYGRFLLPGESLVVVQETEDHTADVIAVLRHISHVSVFAIRPGSGSVLPTRLIGSCANPSPWPACRRARPNWPLHTN